MWKNNVNKTIKTVTAAFIFVLIIGCKKEATNNKENPKPNIIYILADDLGYGDLSFTGQKMFSTPNIDKLAKDGMFFTQHYSGSTVCAPSRSTLLTGLHTGHTFIRGNREIEPEGQVPLDSSVVTISKLLKAGGYTTGAFGKWGLGFPGSEGDPNNQGFDYFYGYNCQRLGHNYYPYHLWDNQKKETLKGNSGTKTETYAPQIIHQKALSFIEKNKNTPFFMYYPSIIPHAELIAPEEYMRIFRDKLLPENHFEGVDNGEKYKNGGYASQAESHAAFAAMITLLDKQVGEIRAKVEELGIADNTIIIFTSDNGPHTEGGADPDYFNSNSSFKGFKRDLYEGGIRVPMIAFWPNKIKPNTTSNHMSAFWDFLPTACDIAELDSPSNIDGISFLPELLGNTNEQKEHDHLYWEFHEKGGKQAVRIGDWKGIRLNMKNDKNAAIELYNLSNDIGETNNVAEDYPEIVNKISVIMDKEHTLSKEFSFNFEK
ncbi:arylsulfatase [Aestuariibaculum suncheonense]|uniref:Arylsulfatase n=1 Tax=Aestuariibaculum suncheonense TaxID=1028745 RepID=A0A8J6UAF0_9FLAO|nr:arylsulfatase [Aestuariibaculum suncheonense]MBD0834765.1 arylsulfatase [Aestuariibaculum suncheonense]